MITYLLKAILCSALLYLVYVLLLEKEKFHRFNRYYLLFSILLSFATPLVTFHGAVPINPVGQITALSDRQNFLTAEPAPATAVVAAGSEKPNPLPLILWSLYLATTALLLLRFLRNLWSMISTIRRNEKMGWEGATLVMTGEARIPYSFLSYIFLDRTKFNHGAIEKEILQHELTHVRQRHSIDILFIELLLTFAWFILPLYLFKRAIATNHEYLADQNVVNLFNDALSYKIILLNKSSLNYHLTLSSSFNFLITKKRLTMMTRKTSPKVAILKQIALIPLVAAIGLLFSTTVAAQDHSKQASNQKVEPRKIMKDAPQSVLDEYHALLAKYNLKISDQAKDKQRLQEKPAITGNTNNLMGAQIYPANVDSLLKITYKDRERMEQLFLQMSYKQQLEEHFILRKIPDLLTTQIPTNQQLELWKDSKIYGIWIGAGRVKNSVLNIHQNTDFQRYQLRQLPPKEAKIMKYQIEVVLTTVSGFKHYNDIQLKRKRENQGRDYMWRVR